MAMIYLSVAILGDIVATLALNEARGFTRLAPILVCVAGYVVSVTFLSLTLQTIPIQLAYAREREALPIFCRRQAKGG